MSGQGLQPILSYAVKGLAGGIGLASESIHAHREKKRSRSRGKAEEDSDRSVSPNPQGPNDEQTLEEGDEEQWELDDAQDDLINGVSPNELPYESSSVDEGEKDATQITERFVCQHPPPAYSELGNAQKLPLPVILAQRRPKDRSRGFIRAYAPELETCGIDQAMFFDFLQTFEKASQASPWLNAINLASIGTFFMPFMTSLLVSVAIQMTVKAAMEVQARHRTNSFLDKINDEFFRPRGLYCLVMTWNPESSETHSAVNLTLTISSSLTPTSGMEKIKKNFRSSSGNTYGELEFPEVAPLIFPALDKLAEQTGEEGVRKRDKLKKKAKFVDEYWDKRARAKFEAKNPASTLVQGPKSTFTSRYADPTHPASSGSLISLVTGGHVNPPLMTRGEGLGGGVGGLLGGRSRSEGGMMGSGMGRDEYMQRGYDRGREGMRGRMGGSSDIVGDVYMQRSYRAGSVGGGRGSMGGPLGGGVGLGGLPTLGGPGVVKKLFKKNVLYLMIVNMPSDEELAAATAAMEQAR